MQGKISFLDYHNLTNDEKIKALDILKNTYKKELTNEYYESIILNTFDSLGISGLDNLITSYNKDTKELIIKTNINKKNISLKEFFKTMNLYCMFNSKEYSMVLEAIEEEEFNIFTRYEYKGNSNFTLIDSNNNLVEDLLYDKPTLFLDDIFGLMHGEFNDSLDLLDKEDYILSNWEKNNYLIEMEEGASNC